MRKKLLHLVLVAVAFYNTTYAQVKSKTLTLQDLTDFRQQAGNWMIAGDVSINPEVDIHHKQDAPQVETGKKKKNQSAPVAPKVEAVTYQAGTGILLNMNDEVKKSNLLSVMEHGDIELELEVMLPKGSNSGIYLQGRYEVQLLDSWGVKSPAYSDIGGIYRNWENQPGKIYMGKAPLSNPAKAPGLWQKFKISFRAPRFNAAGEKIENARFNFVDLNGVRIHDNVEVPLPTGGPIENNEKPFGPLMIQGDHGPVAFRNITYKLLNEANVSLNDLNYQTWYGSYKLISDFINTAPAASGVSPELTCELVDSENTYALAFKGKISVSADATYKFIFSRTGGARLTINNQELVNDQRADGGGEDEFSLDLKAGSYPIEIYNYKDASWMAPRLGLFVQTGSTPKALHAFNSLPPDENPVAQILINAGSEPRLLRAFLDFKGDYKQHLTHTLGVADPGGVNYVYDLKSGNLVCVWKGSFVDATPMWHDRGDGSFRPMGAVQYLFNNQPLANLKSTSDPFPVITPEMELNKNEYWGKGYEMDKQGRPIFKYTYRGIQVTDKVYPDDQNRIVTHEIAFENINNQAGLYYKLAEGKSITKAPNGYYSIDDKAYYIKINGNALPQQREVNGKQELILPVSGSISYSIIW